MTATVSAGRLRQFIGDAFRAVGMPDADAQSVAELMAEASLYGADGHGVFRVPQYVQRIRLGGMNLKPNIRVTRSRGAMALVDGDNGMGHLVMRTAARTAIEKARAHGVGWVGARMSNHAGPALLYVRMVAAEGMCGLYFCVGSSNHLAPWGGIELLLSTNPIAVAVPGLEERPMVLDMATTVSSYGKIKTYAQQGKPMPEGWMIDHHRRPFTDARRAAEGLLLPLGGLEAGYKGYGLALAIGLLAGTLNDASMGREVIDFNADQRSVTNTGHTIVAIDPAAFGDPLEFRRNVDRVLRDIRASKRMPGVDRIVVPGEQSAEKYATRSVSGVPLPPALKASLDAVAAELGIAPLE